MNQLKIIIGVLFGVSLLTMVSCDYPQDEVKTLDGRWKFSIGDNMQWAKTDFDDSKWDNIRVPSSWEDQGYEGYNGFAWYRRQVRIAKKFERVPLYLNIGKVDDADEVYFNGVLIGKTGSFPPAYTGKYDENRRYFIPKNLIHYGGDNVVAVRVYDNLEDGGIREGDIGLFTKGEMSLDVDLSGDWKFHLNDSMVWKESGFDDSSWESIKVPGYFEKQGYERFDGFVWYRKRFDLPAKLKNQRIVAILGKIDDIDQVFINGVYIGGTGTFKTSAENIHINDESEAFRGYYLPENFALSDTGNVIAVRVYDGRGNGGIYEGPVGLINQVNYTEYWGKNRKNWW